ncbi:MAG: endolytic transglycosylase MltG [Betaproteobacteria bacterium]|nr:endolytic transglycosylase MltG [Betaproteobacteria bacterium]
MRSLKYVFLVCVLFLGTFVGWMAWFAYAPVDLQGTKAIDFSIPPGQTLRAASQQMAESGLGFAPWQFTLLARILGKAAEIKAGSYQAEQGITPLTLLEKLTHGDFNQDQIAFVEGKNFRQLRSLLDAHPSIRHDTTSLSDREILRQLKAKEGHPEGLFFPDTYVFARNSSDLEILSRAYRAMQQQLDREWRKRSPKLTITTPYQALIMASLVEKETGQASDRAAIAGVFSNRLRLGMLLQTDPAVIYGLGESFDGNLRKRDLLADSPYNTYTRPGLPPTPIAMPGLAALQASLHPVESDKLYFVARGDGSSEFSHSLEEHNRAVNKYQRGK